MASEDLAVQREDASNSRPAVRSGKPGKRKVKHPYRRITIILLVGLLIIGSVAYLKPSPGSGPAGPRVPAESFGGIWTEREAVLLGIGDSITEGFGASAEKSYFDRLYRNPTDEFPEMKDICLSKVMPNLLRKNMAQSGSTSLQHMEDQVNHLQTQPENIFGIVVMTCGGNDIILNYGKTPPKEGAMYGASFEQAQPWINNFEQRLDLMLTKITNAFPGGCEIFLGNIYDPTDGIGSAPLAGLPRWPDGLKVLAAYNGVITDVVKKHSNAHLIDIHTLFMGHGMTCRMFWRVTYQRKDPHFWYGQVFEDANDRGYDALRRTFLLEMANVLPEKLQ